MVATLAVAVFFPTPGHAAAWGVFIAGILEALLVGGDTWRNGVMTAFRWPKWDEDVKRFFHALGPATIGSAGIQIALFADTIIASFLAAGAISALYYADRLNQLPIGVIGIAVGTVLLPEMASRIATGDEAGAKHAQNRAIELTLLLSIPCLVAFLILPDLIMRALFMRGKFTAADATAAGQTLAAYAFGLLPFVLIRSATAPFLARGDTATPMKASLTAVGVNVGFKAAFYYFTSLAQVGLALATSIGAWLNLGLVIWFAARRGHFAFGPALRGATARLAAAGVALAVVLSLAQGPVARLFANWTSGRDESTLAVLVLIGGAVYGAAVFALFGKQWLAALQARKRSTPPGPPALPD
jgi:putative peptidoglycan lipid II flippase